MYRSHKAYDSGSFFFLSFKEREGIEWVGSEVQNLLTIATVIRNVQRRQMYRQEGMRYLPGAEGGWTGAANRHKVSFRGNANILKLDCGNGCMQF